MGPRLKENAFGDEFFGTFLQATDWLVNEIDNMKNPHSRGNSTQQTNAIDAQATVLCSGVFPNQIYISIR